MSVIKKQEGFTIVELLIATMVFSVVLLLCAAGLIRIGKAYNKGVISSRTQEAARNVIESVSQAIQLNSGYFSGLRGPGPDGETHAYCFGARQFSFIKNKNVVSGSSPSTSETRHALVSHPASSGGCPISASVATINTDAINGQELLSPRMQLADLSVDHQGNGKYEVRVKVLYGEDDLFLNPNSVNATCNSGSGSEFCAVSELKTIVYKRVE